MNLRMLDMYSEDPFINHYPSRPTRHFYQPSGEERSAGARRFKKAKKAGKIARKHRQINRRRAA